MTNANPRPKSKYSASHTHGLNARPDSVISQPFSQIDPLLTEREVRAALGTVSHATLWRWQTGGHFPKPIRIGLRRIGWRLSTVQNWIKAREVASGLIVA
jgi:predicted DNA-binding transcriptional regulator AlpA